LRRHKKRNRPEGPRSEWNRHQRKIGGGRPFTQGRDQRKRRVVFSIVLGGGKSKDGEDRGRNYLILAKERRGVHDGILESEERMAKGRRETKIEAEALG